MGIYFIKIMQKLFLLPILAMLACTPLTQSSVNSGTEPKILTLSDRIYEFQIRTAALHPIGGGNESTLLPAVTQLGQWNLLLEFDDLVTERDSYYAKIIHCNYDWTKSTLLDLDFMTQYNEFNITNFEFSTDTHIPYVHYWFQLPPVKIPGNYVVMIYRNGEKSDVVLTKRFMVYDRRVSFEGERNLVGAGGIASKNQQINFTVNYKNLDIINPMENVKVVVRQNQRWDNMALNIRPSFVREIEKQLEYRFFDDSQMFKGGNEFRFFDLRSLINPGRNIDRVDGTVKPFEVYVQLDKSRKDEAYSQYNDNNGGFILGNLDYRNVSFSNYCYVNFTLASKVPQNSRVFVTGAFHQWNRDEENEMRLDSTTNRYHARLLLRQGWYDYQYVVDSPNQPAYLLEGSHYETENFYEIFVYYKPLQPHADLLIGYLSLTLNQR
jgi:hypothetical protein